MVRQPRSPRKPRKLTPAKPGGQEEQAPVQPSSGGRSTQMAVGEGLTAATAELAADYVEREDLESAVPSGEPQHAEQGEPLDITGEQLKVFDTGTMAPVRDIRSAPSVASSEATWEDAAYALSEESSHVALRDEVSERRAERRAERRRFVGFRVAQVALAVVAVAALGYALFFSPLFALEGANVSVHAPEGSTVAEEDIVAALASEEGTSLFRLRPGHVAELIEQRVPRVRDVAVSRALPHGIVVSYENRVPIACVVNGSSCQPIDAQGHEIEAQGEEAAQLARIEYAGDAKYLGEAAQAVVDVMSVLPEGVAELVSKAEVSETQQIVLVLADGRIIIWGMPGEDEEKAAVLEVILSDPAVLYDVSAPNAPVTGPSPAG